MKLIDRPYEESNSLNIYIYNAFEKHVTSKNIYIQKIYTDVEQIEDIQEVYKPGVYLNCMN